MLGIFLDSETNGLNWKKHKLIEIAYKILDVDSGELKDEFQAVIYQPQEEWQKSDPLSLNVNGFTWEEVQRGIKSDIVATQITNSFKQLGIKRGAAAFICQNPSFDRAFFSQLIDADIQEALLWPYHWLDLASMYWAESIHKSRLNQAPLPWQTGFSKDRIATTCHIPPEGKPHRAMNGVNHLILCYEAVVGFPKTYLNNPTM
jgi:DNA polymerase-3 subunit epsilon/oligoribonuclease